MQEFRHNSGDDSHVAQAFSEQAVGNGTQDRIAGLGNDGRHIQGSANGCLASCGDDGFFADRGTGLVMGRVQTGKGDALAHSLKGRQRATVSQEFGGGQRANAGNGGHQVARVLEIGMLVNLVLNSLFELLNLLFE